MQIKEIAGNEENFVLLCTKLEDFQFNLMPELKEKGYSLTEELNEIKGFIFYDDEKPVASIGLKKVSNKVCEIVRVFVCDEYRGRGYATALFEKIENLAKNLGFEEAEMYVWGKATAARNLYKKLGYSASEKLQSSWFNGLEYYVFKKKL